MSNIVYELQGNSMEAAELLAILTRIRVSEKKPKNEGNFGEIRKSWENFYDSLFRELMQSNPDVLKETGLLSPSIIIDEKKCSAPRAYEEYPAIFIAPLKKLKMYMYVPVGYDGTHFIPEGARQLNEEEAGKVGDLLFAGGWLGNAPVFDRKKQGVRLPVDFKPTPAGQLKNSYIRETFNYLAGGQTLQAVNQYEDALKKYDQAVTTLFDRTRDILKELYPAEDGQEFNRGMSMGYAEHREDLSSGLTGLEINMGNRPMTAPNPHFNIINLSGNSYVALRSDTVEGREFTKLFQHSKRPALKDFVSVDEDELYLFSDQGMKFLQFTSRPKANPADSIKVSKELVQWLKDDNGDRNTGVTPPPMPENLRREYAALPKGKRTRPTPKP